MPDQQISVHPHHHPLTPKLKHTILVTAIIAATLAVMLTIVIVIVTSTIESNKLKNQGTAITDVKTVLKAQEEFVLPENTSNIPSQLDKATLVNVIAKNQPAVVRILTWRCTDIMIRSPSSTLTLSDICGGEVGSGSILSRDGYVGTNGHVVTIDLSGLIMNGLNTTDLVSEYLKILVEDDIVSQKDAGTIIALKIKGDPKADVALQQLTDVLPSTIVTTKKNEVSYAVQLGNEPIRVSQVADRIAVEYSNSVVAATLIDQDFDAASSKKALTDGSAFTSSDVAILKMTKGEYPYVELGSITGLVVGDQLTAIGFPGFVDNSINTEQWQTVPSITQGKIKSIDNDAAVSPRKILSTTVKIAQGNSGGPAFNNAGLQIGINTYGSFDCADTKCFGDGTIRDIADLIAILKKDSITLEHGGITTDWNNALDAYTNGNYSTALALFQKVETAYPSNYLVAPLARLARQQVGSKTDTSSAFQAKDTVIVVIIILSILATVIIGTITFLIIYFNRKHRRALGISRQGVLLSR